MVYYRAFFTNTSKEKNLPEKNPVEKKFGRKSG